MQQSGVYVCVCIYVLDCFPLYFAGSMAELAKISMKHLPHNRYIKIIKLEMINLPVILVTFPLLYFLLVFFWGGRGGEGSY